VQDLFAKLLEKRFDRKPCCAGILTEHRLVSAYINRIINVA